MLKISVLFLTLNKPHIVQQCFNSLKYMHADKDILEWLILDNNSSDINLKHYLKNEFSDNRKVKVFFSDENLGVAGGRDFLMQKAQGQIFLILDSDVFAERRA